MAAAVHHPPRFTSISTMKNDEASASTNGPYFLEDGIISSLEEMEKMKQDAKLQLQELLAGEFLYALFVHDGKRMSRSLLFHGRFPALQSVKSGARAVFLAWTTPRGETRLKCPDNDAFLVKFLRARKYNVDSAFKNITKYFKVRRNHPELFGELDPDFVLFDTVCRKHKLVALSREKDSKGRAIILLNLGTWNTGICPLENFFRVGIALVEHLLLDEEVQLNGVVFVMDFKNLGIYHLTQYTIPVIKRLLSLMQTILFGTDWNKLRSLIPDDIIPEEGGGRLETYDYDAMERDLKSRAEYFREMSSCGYLDKSKE